ncbi:MAG TPA: YtxH domain-containing protein [Chitinophagaceae bacterium]
MTTTSKIALGIGGALAAGVIIGLLVAPEKGKESRKFVKDKTGKLVDGLSRLFSRVNGDGQLSQQQVRTGKGTSAAIQ